MKSHWKDQDVTKALKTLAPPFKGEFWTDRVWLKVETRLLDRQKPFWGFTVWRPWGHPIRWVAAAACFFVVLAGVMNHTRIVDQTEMASYMISVSNPTENLTNDLGIVPVSALLAEPSITTGDLILTGEDHLESLATDEIYL